MKSQCIGGQVQFTFGAHELGALAVLGMLGVISLRAQTADAPVEKQVAPALAENIFKEFIEQSEARAAEQVARVDAEQGGVNQEAGPSDGVYGDPVAEPEAA